MSDSDRIVDRFIAGLAGTVILLWLAFTIWFYTILVTPMTHGLAHFLAALLASLLAVLAVFIIGLVALAVLLLAAAVLK